MALNQSVVNRQYSPTGVNFPDGLRVGSFNMGGTNTVGLGVPVGNTQVYSIKPKSSTDPLTDPQIVQNNSYFKLNTNYLIPGAVTVLPNSIKLDVPRIVSIAANAIGVTFSAKFSVRDRYGQIQVFQGDAINEGGAAYGFIPKQGFDEIVSIYLYNISTPNSQFSLQLLDIFDLPYSDIGYGEVFGDVSRIRSIHLGNAPLIQIVTASVAPYPAKWIGVIEPGNSAQEPEQGLNTNTRPQYQYFSTANPINGQVLAIEQAVDQYGWTFNGAPYTDNVNNYENKLRKIIGPQPYAIGWTDWQG